MFLPNGYTIVCSEKVIAPVDVKLTYGDIAKCDLKVTITPTENKKETKVEVIGCRVVLDNIEEDGLMLILCVDGNKPRPILRAIKDDKKNLNRLIAVCEHITSYVSKLTNEPSSVNKLIIATPYRGCGNKDYNKTVVNVSLMENLEINDHLSCDFIHTDKYLLYIEEQLKEVLTQNRFNEFS